MKVLLGPLIKEITIHMPSIIYSVLQQSRILDGSLSATVSHLKFQTKINISFRQEKVPQFLFKNLRVIVGKKKLKNGCGRSSAVNTQRKYFQ